jgi:hypothetical protein
VIASRPAVAGGVGGWPGGRVSVAVGVLVGGGRVPVAVGVAVAGGRVAVAVAVAVS